MESTPSLVSIVLTIVVILKLQLLTILLQTFCKTNCRSYALRSSRGNEPTVIAKSDDLQSRKRGQSVEFFSFNF